MTAVALDFDPALHRYSRGGIILPGVTSILQATGFVDFSYVDAVRLERASDLGRKVHRAIELYVLDDLDMDRLDPAIRPYLDAYISFVDQTGFICTRLEKPLAHPLYGYAGMPDQGGYLELGRAVVDTKISVSLGRWVALQLAGYEELVRADEPGDKSPIHRFGLRLGRNGKPLITPYTDRRDRNVFLAALSCVNSDAHPMSRQLQRGTNE